MSIPKRSTKRMWEAMAAAGLASVMMLTLALAGTANSADITFAPYASNQFTAGCMGNLGLCDFGGLMYQPALSRFIVDANVGPIVAGKLYTFPAAGGVNSATAFAQSTGIADLTSLFETNIVFSTGLGGFNNNDVFVSAGCKIYDIAPDGSSATLLATVPGGFTKYVGLVMDTTVNNPPFNNNLVAVTPDGNAFTITSAGVVTLVGNFGVVEGESPMGTPPPGTNAGFEQPVIIPPSQSSPIAGQLVVAAEQNDVVLAMSKAGVVTTVASTATGLPTFFGSPQFGMETLLLLPPTIGTAGVPDGLFTIQSGDNILYNAPSSQFTALPNHLITGSEFSDVWVDLDISVNPAVVTTHTLDLNGLPLGTDNLIEQQWVFVNAPAICTDYADLGLLEEPHWFWFAETGSCLQEAQLDMPGSWRSRSGVARWRLRQCQRFFQADCDHLREEGHLRSAERRRVVRGRERRQGELLREVRDSVRGTVARGRDERGG